jgi:hypothetical protein
MAHSHGSGRYEEPRISYVLAGRAVSTFADETEFLKNLPNSWHELVSEILWSY